MGAAGSATDGFIIGGQVPGGNSNATEEWDGSSWTTGGNYPAAMFNQSASGTGTAGLGFGGYTDTALTTSAEYDGSSWTAGNSLTVARHQFMGGGTQTAAWATGALTSRVITEHYDGTSWGTAPSKAQTVYAGGSGGTQTAGLVAGGNTGSGKSNVTEEFTGKTTAASAKTIDFD